MLQILRSKVILKNYIFWFNLVTPQTNPTVYNNPKPEVKTAESYYNLSITVAVGIGFLVINLCIYVIIINKVGKIYSFLLLLYLVCGE